MDEKEYNVVVLEDGTEYAEINKINLNEKTYLLLVNLKNDNDFCIRRLINENGEEVLIGLDSKEEFDQILNIFLKNNFN